MSPATFSPAAEASITWRQDDQHTGRAAPGEVVGRGPGEDGFVAATVVALVMSLFLVAGLVYDGGLILAARQRAYSEASAAARAGAQAMSSSTMTGGAVDSDPGRAVAAAQAYLDAVGHAGSATVAGDQVEVTVSIPYQLVILGAAGINDATVTGSARVRAQRGVTQAEP